MKAARYIPAKLIGALALVKLFALMATVTNLTAVHRDGQTFLTFTEVAGVGVTYSVYRHTSEITSGNIGGLTAVATLDQDSGLNLYTSTGFVIEDEGSPLASSVGLLVWTTATSGTYFYAVTNSGDASLSAGNNSLTSGVAETHQEYPGAVLLSYDDDNGASHEQFNFIQWRDYASWNHDDWEHYAHRFNVHIPGAVWALTPPYPLWLILHAAGNNGYTEPASFVSPGVGIVVTAIDQAFTGGLTDPFNGASYIQSKWCGRFDAVSGLYKTITEEWLADIIALVRDDARFDVDSNRIYVIGASLGSGAMHFASHYPDLITAARASIGFIDDAALAPTADAATIEVNEEGGPTLEVYQDMAAQAAMRPFPPIVHTFNKDDATIDPTDYPAALTAFEDNRQPFAAKWQDGNHSEFYLTGAWALDRFVKNEGYPCFADASNSDAFADQEGERNVQLDWHSSRHSISGGSAIVDTDMEFGISLIALDVPATAEVTIRNQQTFTNNPGANVNWSDGSGSGSVSINADGSITVPGVTIGTSATRLSITVQATPGITARNALRTVRRM